MLRILVLNGPNLSTLGEREPEVYGSVTLHAIETAIEQQAAELGVAARCVQSNHEGTLVDTLEEERGSADGCIINPGGLSHTSVVLADAVRAFGHPVVEVHLSNIYAREPYRRISLCAEAASAVIAGLGAAGYSLALEGLVTMLRAGAKQSNEEKG
jgi:3-dehydroquinate dehydratase-2